MSCEGGDKKGNEVREAGVCERKTLHSSHEVMHEASVRRIKQSKSPCEPVNAKGQR